MHTITSGGSRLTDANALTVMPWSFPLSSCVVTIVTPEAKRPSTLRNVSESIMGTSCELQRASYKRGARCKRARNAEDVPKIPQSNHLACRHKVAGHADEQIGQIFARR